MPQHSLVPDSNAQRFDRGAGWLDGADRATSDLDVPGIRPDTFRMDQADERSNDQQAPLPSRRIGITGKRSGRIG